MNITLDDGRTELWQWDTGRKIVIDDKSVSEVHYSKYSSTQAITREVINGKAEIPNFLLQDTHAVTAYAYSGSIENGYTMAEKTFNVVKKPKPANYVETEEDKAILAKLKEQIGNLSELQTEAKNNLVSAINEAAASGGADWSQNDPDGDGYVANRPGGYDMIETRKILETKLVSINDESMVIADADGSFAEGDPVYVSIDGAPEVTYNVIVTATDGQTVYSFGSKSFEEVVAGGLGATDYIVVWYEGGGKRAYQGIAGADLVGKTIVARADVAIPVKIPDKYLELDSAKEIMQFTISYNQSSKAYESDRTYDELKAALNAGKLVLARFWSNVGMGELCFYGWLNQSGMYTNGIWVYVGGSSPYEWECMKGNKWTKNELLRLGTGYTTPKKAGTAAYGTSDYASRDDHVHPSELPDVSADDDGKLLGVTGGAWGKVDKPSGGDSDFVVNASLDDNNNCTVDKTYTQIQEAVQDGKKPVVHLESSYILNLFLSSDGAYAFSGSATVTAGFTAQVTVSIQSSNEVFFDMSYALNVSGDRTINQVKVDEDPREAMEIATKKYVDDKEFILKSTTPNSTKKFKITVDDSGAISATEVTTS